MKKKYYIVLILMLCAFDQVSKLLVVKYLSNNDSLIIINNLLKFLYIKNTGISFGILSGQKYIIVALSILIIGYMIYEFIKSNNRLHLISVVLIISGALGNLIDRLFRGYVVDFISFSFFGYEASIFNVADSFITIGVILYIINILMEGKYEKHSSRK